MKGTFFKQCHCALLGFSQRKCLISIPLCLICQNNILLRHYRQGKFISIMIDVNRVQAQGDIANHKNRSKSFKITRIRPENTPNE